MNQEGELKPFEEETHLFYNEKEKSFIRLKLFQEEKYILINYSKSNNSDSSEITHQTKYTYNKIKDNDIEYFYPFNNDIILLFKLLYRICMVNYYQINFDKNDNIIMTLFCFFHKQMKFINIIIPKIKENFNDDYYLDIKEEETNNRPCPPVVKTNIFIYLTKRKEEYKIEITKTDTDIIFTITESPNETEKEDENQLKEFIARKNFIDFLYLAESYYLLFNGSLDDIYSDLLFNFYNNNFELRKIKKEIRIYIYVFNLRQLSNREAYLSISISTKLKVQEKELKKIEPIIPKENKIIQIKNETIHLNMLNKSKMNMNLHKNKSEDFGDKSIISKSIIENNYDEETDTKNNIDDLRNDIQTFNNEEQKEIKSIEIEKKEFEMPNPTLQKEEYKSEENIKINRVSEKQDNFLVTKIIGITNNKNEVDELNEDKLLVKDAFGENERLKIKNTNINIIDKKEEQKDNNDSNFNKNFNFINSIIINYVDINNCKKREIYNFVLDNINDDNYPTLEQISNKEEMDENDNSKKIHKINLGRKKDEKKKQNKIKKIKNKFLMKKRRNTNYTISKYFIEKSKDKEKEKK